MCNEAGEKEITPLGFFKNDRDGLGWITQGWLT